MQISIRLSTLMFLISFNIAMYILPLILAVMIFSNTAEGYNMFLQLFGGFSTQYVLVNGEWWRAITGNFLHIINPLHLLANMYVLYQIGSIVEEYFGGKWLFMFYLTCGAVANVASMPFLQGDLAVGASAAVFGLVGVLLGSSRKRNPYGVDVAFNISDVLPLILFAVMINFIPGVNIGNAAHIAGLVVGGMLGFLVPHKLTMQRGTWDVVEQYGFYLAILIMLFSYAFVVANIISTIIG